LTTAAVNTAFVTVTVCMPSVHEIRTATGMVIHEYMSNQGKVFGVSWWGPGLPDTTQLLGGYSTQLVSAGCDWTSLQPP
jgi:hypothetical protein